LLQRNPNKREGQRKPHALIHASSDVHEVEARLKETTKQAEMTNYNTKCDCSVALRWALH